MLNTLPVITLDVLQQLEGKTGTLIGIPLENQVICLGVSSQ